MYAITGRRNLILVYLTTGSSIAHSDQVKVDWPADIFLNAATASFSGAFGIYLVIVLAVFPTPLDISQITVTVPEPATLPLLVIGYWLLALLATFLISRDYLHRDFKVIETEFRVSAGFTKIGELSL